MKRTAVTALIAIALMGCGTDEADDGQSVESTPEATEQAPEGDTAEESDAVASTYSEECGQAMQAAATVGPDFDTGSA